MTERDRILVVENVAYATLDRFEGWIGEGEVEVVRPHAGDPMPAAASRGLIVLGGPMSATDDAEVPWLAPTRDLLAASVDAGVPTLGICLGAQLLAVACGGSVETWAAPGREAGVIDVRWRDAAAHDPLVGGLPDPFPAASSHRDAVDRLPEGATWLGFSDRYPHHAFRVGEAAWGLQFHPEVSPAAFRRWMARYSDVDGDAVSTEFERRDAEVAAAGRAVAERFAALCR